MRKANCLKNVSKLSQNCLTQGVSPGGTEGVSPVEITVGPVPTLIAAEGRCSAPLLLCVKNKPGGVSLHGDTRFLLFREVPKKGARSVALERGRPGVRAEAPPSRHPCNRVDTSARRDLGVLRCN